MFLNVPDFDLKDQQFYLKNFSFARSDSVPPKSRGGVKRDGVGR